jgi:hypothetical protein
MKKIVLIAFVLFIFGCKKSDKTIEEQRTIEDQSVEIGSGTEISPQVVGVEDSAKRLEVDTISSAKEAQGADSISSAKKPK